MSKIPGLNMMILGALLCMQSLAVTSQAAPVGSVNQAIAAPAKKAEEHAAATVAAPAKTAEEHKEAKDDLKKMLNGKSPSEIAALGKQVLTAGGVVGKAAVAAVSALVSTTKWPTCPDGFAAQRSGDGCCASQALKHMKQAKMLCESDGGGWKTAEEKAESFTCCPPAPAPAPVHARVNADNSKEVADLKAQVAALKAQIEKDHAEAPGAAPAKASQASSSKVPAKNVAGDKKESPTASLGKAFDPKKNHGKKSGTTEEDPIRKMLEGKDPMMKMMMGKDPFSKDPFSNSCDKLSRDGHCGPRHGGKICSTLYHSFAKYCNEANGWCGDTDAHKNAQPSTAYDSGAPCNPDMNEEEDPIGMPKISGMPPVMEELLEEMNAHGGAGSEDIIEIHPGPNGKMVETHTHLNHPASQMQVLDMDPLLLPERQSNYLPSSHRQDDNSWFEQQERQYKKQQEKARSRQKDSDSWQPYHYMIIAALVLGLLWWFSADNSDMRSVFVPGFGNVKLGGKKMDDEHCDLFAHSEGGYGGATPMSNVASDYKRPQTHGHRFKDNFDSIDIL